MPDESIGNRGLSAETVVAARTPQTTKIMQSKIDSLRTTSQSLRQALLALENLDRQEGELKSAHEKVAAQLAKLPVEALTAPEGDDKPFDRATSRMIVARGDICVKLDLLPGIRVRFRAQAEGLRYQVRGGVKALAHHCRDLASAKLEKALDEVATQLLPQYAGVAEDARAAAARVMLGPDQWDLPGRPAVACNARRWLETFAHWEHQSDPLSDAEAAIALAESFERGEPVG